MRFSATGLPPSLSLDPETGIIKGSAPEAKGEYPITLKASNQKGAATRKFMIVVGDQIALTPPMGWNDWYTHYDRVTDAAHPRGGRRTWSPPAWPTSATST